MSNVTTTVRAKIVTAETPLIYNLAMATANTEYAQALSSETKRLLIRFREKAKGRIAFVVNGTTTAYITLERGAVYCEDSLNLTGVTIYLQSDVGSQVAEILQWT